MITLSPKLSFLGNSKRADLHSEIVLNPVFRSACEIAFAEYCYSLNGMDPTSAPKMEGAKKVLETLLNLGEQPKTQQPISNDQLTPV